MSVFASIHQIFANDIGLLHCRLYISAMSKIVNLNHARKSRARSEKRAKADGNAVAFGRTKAEKTKMTTQNAKADRDLDGKVLTARAHVPPDTPDQVIAQGSKAPGDMRDDEV